MGSDLQHSLLLKYCVSTYLEDGLFAAHCDDVDVLSGEARG